MNQHPTKLGRVLAIVMSFVMAFSVVLINPVDVSAAPAKYVKSLKLSKTKVTVAASKTTKVTATVKVNKKTANKKVTAKSSKPSVATVKVGKVSGKKTTGKTKITITGKSAGTAKITVTTKAKNKKNKKIKKTITVTVTAPAAQQQQQQPTTPQYTDVKITSPTTADGSSPSVAIGTSTKLTADVAAADAAKIVWTSSNTSVAVVDKDGVVTGTGAGTADIIATIDGKQIGKIPVTITSVPVTGISFDQAEATVSVSNSIKLVPTVVPANATDRTYKLTSSNENVATVDQNGNVTAIAPGTATITATSTDRSFQATCVITVPDNSKTDVTSLEAKVTNSIEGYENTVLAGTRAKIEITAKKDGNPLSDEDVFVEISKLYGYLNYELSDDQVTLKNGTATVYLKPNPNTDLQPIFNNDDDAAYGSYQLAFSAGGANLEKTITVNVAQIKSRTEHAGENDDLALTVENNRNITLPEIDNRYSPIAVQETKGKSGLGQEYVVDELYSSADDSDQTVYLDAAPLLIRAATSAGAETGEYEVDVKNCSQTEYSVYEGEKNGNTLQKVPGGLQYLNLNFTTLQLSDYTRLVVRAYEPDTNIPVLDEDRNLVQQIFTKKDITAKKGKQVDQTVFSKTSDKPYIDLKVFIESAGQVNNEENAGYVLNHLSGTFRTDVLKVYEDLPLRDAVKWEIGTFNDQYDGQTLSNEDAAKYLDNVDSNSDYEYFVPSFPDTGNAIITEYRHGTKDVLSYHMYPTTTEDNQVVLRPIGGKYSTSYGFLVTEEAARELESSSVHYGLDNETGYFKVSADQPGYVHIKANVDIAALAKLDAATKAKYPGLTYNASSYVLFSPTPSSKVVTVADYYALAGQTVTLVATTTDKGGNQQQSANVNWEYDNDSIVTTETQKEPTGSKAINTLTFTSSGAADVTDISATTDEGTNISYTIGGQKVTTTKANIHWIQPGLVYKPSALDDDDVYDTFDDDWSDGIPVVSQYQINNEWILGVQALGRDSGKPKQYYTITNLKVDLTPSSSSENSKIIETKWLSQEATENGIGVAKAKSDVQGQSEITASIAGFADGTENTEIKQIIYDNETGTIIDQIPLTYVGKGKISANNKIKIPINWVPDITEIELIAPNKKFTTDKAGDATVYVHTHDSSNGAVAAAIKVVINGPGINNQEIPATTEANGYLPINLASYATNNMLQPGEYTVRASLTNSAATTDPVIINVNDPADKTFTLIPDGVRPDEANNQIRLIFTSKPDVAINEFFIVGDNGATWKASDIESIEPDENNAKALIIKFKNTRTVTSTTEVNITNSYTDQNTGITTYFVNENGVPFLN